MSTIKHFLYNKIKASLFLKITCFCWLLAKLLSWRIWTTNRLLPTAPVFAWLNYVPFVVHVILFMVSISLMGILVFKTNKHLLMGLLLTEGALCLLDLNRLLPWEYFYCFIAFSFLVNYNRPKRITPIIIFLLASTYFYSGLCKLNVGFIDTVWSNMILKSFFKISAHVVQQSWLQHIGYLLGVAELLAGVGLLFAKTRTKAAIVLILTHIFILLLLGPFVFRGYTLLWPWNMLMILFLTIIIVKRVEHISILQSLTMGWNKLILLCWGILPVLSFWGYWDYNLSSNLFSANLPRMMICIKDTAKCKSLSRFCSKRDMKNTCNGLAKIDIQVWAIAETGVSAYPEVRTYKAMQKKIEQEYGAAGLSFVY